MSIPQTLSPALPAGYSLQEYSIESVLGIGGFGITYLAHDNHLHHKVAIKEFFPANLAARNHATGAVGIKSPDCQEEFTWGKTRYAQEAQTLARFNHPSIVRVYRYFEANSTSYMVMAFEEGRSLADALAAGQIDWTEARITELITSLLAGLAEVHKAGFLHRDIKPENILLRDKDGTPVLLDFGSARSLMSNHTMTAMVSPGYGPVEQYSSDQGDQGPWTDIYALAAVLYRIVSGQVPVPAPNRVKKDSLMPAAFAGAGRYSKPFLAAIDQALSIDETKRPQDVLAWSALLTARPAATTPGKAAVATSEPSPPPASSIRVSPADRRDTSEVITSRPRGTGEGMTPLPARAGTLVKRGRASGQESSFTARKVGLGVIWAVIGLAIALGGLLATDWGYLRVAYFVFTTGTEIRNPDMTYAVLCPSYFQSEMSIKDIKASWADPSGPKTTERFQGLTKESPTRATITSAVSVDGTPAGTVTQTWSRKGMFWCRDVVVDFREQKAKAGARRG